MYTCKCLHGDGDDDNLCWWVFISQFLRHCSYEDEVADDDEIG